MGTRQNQSMDIGTKKSGTHCYIQTRANKWNKIINRLSITGLSHWCSCFKYTFFNENCHLEEREWC